MHANYTQRCGSRETDKQTILIEKGAVTDRPAKYIRRGAAAGRHTNKQIYKEAKAGRHRDKQTINTKTNKETHYAQRRAAIG